MKRVGKPFLPRGQQLKMSSLIPLWNGFAYEKHQVVGVDWMIKREDEANEHRGGLLCDEMGLGKTIQIIGLLKSSPRKFNLLVAPLAVLEQWRDVATRAHLNCWTLEKGHDSWLGPQRLRLKEPHLYLINYESAVRNKELLGAKPWDRIICDEAHRLASGGQAYQLIQELNAPIHWLMTATPLVNRLKDIKNLFALVGPEFSMEKVKTYVLARTMEELREKLPHLPKKAIEKTHHLEFETSEEKEFYQGIQGMIVRRWKALKEDGEGGALARLRLIMRLRQISLHPQVYIESRKRNTPDGVYCRPDWMTPSTKFNTILDLIEEEEKPKRWILFCHFHDEMRLLKEFLTCSEKISDIWTYSGSCSRQERTDILRDTHKPLEKHQVLLIQLQAGGVGLNLQHFSRIIFSGPWWTSALMEQAIGRAVRIGQKEQVMVHHVVLREEEGLNIDRLMRNKAEEKGALCKTILEAANRTICSEGA